MREDMAKVVTERPRCRGGLKAPKGYYKKLESIPAEDQPKREKIRQKWIEGYEGKEFTDVLGPLRGYVHSIIGKPFDKVFSDIKKTLPGDNMSVRHVLGHLWDMLIRNVAIDEQGRPCDADLSYRYSDLVLEYEHRGVIAYVDPRDGIIKRAPTYKRAAYKEEPKPYVWKGDKLYYLINDVWYEIEVGTYSVIKSRLSNRYSHYFSYATELKGFNGYWSYDVVFKRYVSVLQEWELSKAYGKTGVYAANKRQLNKQEIKRLGLRKEKQ